MSDTPDYSSYDEPPEDLYEAEFAENERLDPDRHRDEVALSTGLQSLRDEMSYTWDLHHRNDDGSLAPGVRKCPHCWGPAHADNPICPHCAYEEKL